MLLNLKKKISKGFGNEITIKGDEVSIWLKCLSFLNQPMERFSKSMNTEEIVYEATKYWSKSLIKPLRKIEIDDNIHT